MQVKDIWTQEDFEDMGWHDSLIHAISFPGNDLKFHLDIDYIFKWVLDEQINLYKFWVSPCILSFENVLDLKLDLDFKNCVGLDIQDIKRNNPHLSPNGKMTIWDFEIITPYGSITFEATGYNQRVKKQPIFIQSQSLDRDSW